MIHAVAGASEKCRGATKSGSSQPKTPGKEKENIQVLISLEFKS